MSDGNRLASKQGLTNWHCLFCQNKLRSLDKRRVHEETYHPKQMALLEIQYVWQQRQRMGAMIEEYFALGELLQEEVSKYVEPLIKQRMKEIGRQYRGAMGFKGQHPLDHMAEWMKRLQDRLAELIA